MFYFTFFILLFLFEIRWFLLLFYFYFLCMCYCLLQQVHHQSWWPRQASDCLPFNVSNYPLLVNKLFGNGHYLSAFELLSLFISVYMRHICDWQFTQAIHIGGFQHLHEMFPWLWAVCLHEIFRSGVYTRHVHGRGQLAWDIIMGWMLTDVYMRHQRLSLHKTW